MQGVQEHGLVALQAVSSLANDTTMRHMRVATFGLPEDSGVLVRLGPSGRVDRASLRGAKRATPRATAAPTGRHGSCVNVTSLS